MEGYELLAFELVNFECVFCGETVEVERSIYREIANKNHVLAVVDHTCSTTAYGSCFEVRERKDFMDRLDEEISVLTKDL